MNAVVFGNEKEENALGIRLIWGCVIHLLLAFLIFLFHIPLLSKSTLIPLPSLHVHDYISPITLFPPLRRTIAQDTQLDRAHLISATTDALRAN